MAYLWLAGPVNASDLTAGAVVAKAAVGDAASKSRTGFDVIMLYDTDVPFLGSDFEGRATESDNAVAVAPSNLNAAQQHATCESCVDDTMRHGRCCNQGHCMFSYVLAALPLKIGYTCGSAMQCIPQQLLPPAQARQQAILAARTHHAAMQTASFPLLLDLTPLTSAQAPGCPHPRQAC